MCWGKTEVGLVIRNSYMDIYGGGIAVKKFITVLAAAVMLIATCIPAAYAAKETKYTLTKELDRVRTQHDGGYSVIEEIGKDDPHYGWGLGSFYITGYTEVVKDENGNPVFLKNVGDELVLGFDLKKNIDKLGKNKDCRINEDLNGYDKLFEVAQTDFGRGCLIVSETDYKNEMHKPVIYSNYLTAVQNKTANTKVKPFAEGDYVVALDYELKSPGFLGAPAYSDYSITFAFKIRNSNCMVFFYNVGENKDEITNGAVAENGFKIDFKNSYFLNVIVTKEILVDNDGVLTLDTRFNKAASDGSEYTDEGLYTITVSNQYTKEKVTKRISVGQNKVLNVYAAHNGLVDLNEIAKKLDQGVEINDQWMMVLPEAKAEDTYNDKGTEYDGFRTVGTEEPEKKETKGGLFTPFNISIFALAVIVLIILIKLAEKRKKGSGTGNAHTDASQKAEVGEVPHLIDSDKTSDNRETEEGEDK